MTGGAPSLVIHGAGRMGRQLVEAAAAQDFELRGVVARHRPDWLAAGLFFDALSSLEHAPDVVVDFSLPDGAVAAARWCADHGVPLVSGTTGMDAAQEAAFDTAAATVPVLWAANFSIGLNACLVLARRMRELAGPGASARILDIHHAGKRDAPSGTSLALGAALGGEVDYDSVREGDAIGEHHVVLELGDERIELRHEALDRRVFATGALRAARWLLNRSPGRYAMLDCVSATGSGTI